MKQGLQTKVRAKLDTINFPFESLELLQVLTHDGRIASETNVVLDFGWDGDIEWRWVFRRLGVQMNLLK